MFAMSLAIGARVYDFMQRYMPTNILLRVLRTRRGLKWGVAAMLLAPAYILVGLAIQAWQSDGGPGWLTLFIGICAWNALKFFVFGPISVVLLARARVIEWRVRRYLGRQRAGSYLVPVDGRVAE